MNKSFTEFSIQLDGIQEVLEKRNDQFVKDLEVAKFNRTEENNQMKGSCDDNLRTYDNVYGSAFPKPNSILHKTVLADLEKLVKQLNNSLAKFSTQLGVLRTDITEEFSSEIKTLNFSL